MIDRTQTRPLAVCVCVCVYLQDDWHPLIFVCHLVVLRRDRYRSQSDIHMILFILLYGNIEQLTQF